MQTLSIQTKEEETLHVLFILTIGTVNMAFLHLEFIYILSNS